MTCHDGGKVLRFHTIGFHQVPTHTENYNDRMAANGLTHDGKT